MNHRALSLSFLTALGAVLLFAAPAAAQDESECQPDDLFCARVRIGPAEGGIRIGPGQGTPPPPPAQPDPPVVVVQPEHVDPPPPQQPPTVVVQPQQPPQQTYVVQQPPRTQRVVIERERSRFPYSTTGLHLHIDGIFGDELGMGGAGAAFRIRPNPWFAIDIGGALYGGNDYNGLDRVELPLTVDAMVFFNPQHRFQFYMLLGVGGSYGYAEGVNRFTGNFDSRDYFHLGGEAGIGVEWRIARWFALNLDVRGFLRHRVDDNPNPEFTEPNDSGGWRSTDFSGGFTGRAGMTFYFGR